MTTDPKVEALLEGLDYIAASPPPENDGFDPRVVALAKDAAAEVRRLTAENDNLAGLRNEAECEARKQRQDAEYRRLACDKMRDEMEHQAAIAQERWQACAKLQQEAKELREAFEVCRGWLYLQVKREGCLTTAGDIVEDIANAVDSPESFKSAVLAKHRGAQP